MTEIDIKIGCVSFWTDSVSTLMYLRKTTKRFKIFVVNGKDNMLFSQFQAFGDAKV